MSASIAEAVKQDREIEKDNQLLAYKLNSFIEDQKIHSKLLDINAVLSQVQRMIVKNCDCKSRLESSGENVKYCYCL